MFCKRLREARMRRGFTQPQLADILGVALRTYQQYEQGIRNPSFDSLVLLADTLDVSTDWLLDRTDAAPFGE